MKETSIGGAGREFPETRWTLVTRSREGPEARSRALEELLAAYWKPLYYHVRRKGHSVEDSKDAIQGFFAQLLDRDFLERLDPEKGKLRSYLRTALDNFLHNRHEASAAAKRGGGARTVALDWDVDESLAAPAPDPSAAFDRAWALAVMERALARLRADYESGERKGPFELVRRFFDFTGEPPSYESAAEESGMSVSQLKAFLHRARVRFRELVKEEVRETVAGEDPEAELETLMKALRP